ncbi:MAG: hypothetical protein CFH34_01729 [Alphaproteobacteria bacterium MarineAlpha9_Bin4]|nr:DUF1289 domain-containing protein [Pelagibacterales bacterium]PPR24673.1 MAG: hypothetical protein CFH34_01729 [Alphaproteobacteria bacterium MarineAlpha9_Bin4]
MIESPCVGVCTVVKNKCIGCTRTSEEISNWLFYSDCERKIITRRCLKVMKEPLKERNSR